MVSLLLNIEENVCHSVSNHAEKKDKDQSYFEQLEENSKRQHLDQTSQFHQKKIGVVKASYEVSLLVAQNMKAHTIAESLVLPAAKTLVRNLIGDEAAAKLDNVSLSNDTVKRRTQEMSGDIADQVMAGVKDSKFGFAIQLDELTDVAKCSQLLVYVRFIQNNTVKTELMLNQELAATTKGKDVFSVLADFFKENELDWSKLDARQMVLQPCLCKNLDSNICKRCCSKRAFVHCFVHRFAFCTKVLPAELMSCLNKIIKIVNFIKTSALNSRLFARLCEDVSSAHKCLLFHMEVRWLSRGYMTGRVFKLRHELLTFFKEKNHEFKDDFENDNFISQMAYLSDIFQALNVINLLFQGSNSNITVFISKLEAFTRKLDVWTKNVESKQFGMFQLLTALSVEPNDQLSQEIHDHLKLLRMELLNYFPDLVSCTYAVNPFCIDPALLPVGTGEQEEIIDIQVDDTAKSKLNECSPIDFWLIMGSTYPTSARNAVRQLLIFPSIWECEQGFSALMAIKSKSRNRLSLDMISDAL